MKDPKALSFLDSETNRRRVRSVFFASLVVLLIVEVFVDKHVHFAWETAAGFYAVYGFIACVTLILVAKLLRMAVRRREDYYD